MFLGDVGKKTQEEKCAEIKAATPSFPQEKNAVFLSLRLTNNIFLVWKHKLDPEKFSKKKIEFFSELASSTSFCHCQSTANSAIAIKKGIRRRDTFFYVVSILKIAKAKFNRWETVVELAIKMSQEIM